MSKPLPYIETTVIRYPWKTMEIGEHFILPKKFAKKGSNHANWANNEYSPKVFVTHLHSDGLRHVWRIE